MDKNRPITTYEQIKKTIQDKKKKVRQDKLKKHTSLIIKIVVGMTIALLAFLYDRSDFSKIKKVEVVGNYFVTDQEIINDLDLKIPSSFYSFLSSGLEKKLDDKSLVKKVSIQKNWLSQSMTIHVIEKEVLGYYITDKIYLVADDGSTRPLLKNELSHLNQLVRITNFKVGDQLQQLIGGLSRVDKVLLSNISEVIRLPKSYDPNYLRVIMGEGIEVHTSIYSLEKLTANTYRQMLNRLQKNQNCIVYDIFWKSAFAKSCESQAEPVEIKLEDIKKPVPKTPVKVEPKTPVKDEPKAPVKVEPKTPTKPEVKQQTVPKKETKSIQKTS